MIEELIVPVEELKEMYAQQDIYGVSSQEFVEDLLEQIRLRDLHIAELETLVDMYC